MQPTRETLEAAGWRLTTDHPASSYGIPVLVAPDGGAVGSADPVRVLPDGTLADDALGDEGELVTGLAIVEVLCGPPADTPVRVALRALLASGLTAGRLSALLAITKSGVQRIASGAVHDPQHATGARIIGLAAELEAGQVPVTVADVAAALGTPGQPMAEASVRKLLREQEPDRWADVELVRGVPRVVARPGEWVPRDVLAGLVALHPGRVGRAIAERLLSP
jgi:hypothetical protein